MTSPLAPYGNRQPNGRIVHCIGGYQAYVPAPLPPPINWDQNLSVALSSADRAISRLAGEGRRLSNPHLLLRPFVRKEAVLSSRIEGTQTTLGELFAAEAGTTTERDPADLREVGNYVTALEYGLNRLGSLPVSLRLVREMHERLMRGVRGNTATPGEFRRTQNWIGPPGATLSNATYVPPPVPELMPCLDSWERFLHDKTLPPLINIALAHSQFEAIHPFIDGNGRVGRLLITLQLVWLGIIPSPLLYLSAYFESTRQEYYSHLQEVTEHGKWEEWLVYFLRGVVIQSDDALKQIRRIEELVSGWKRQLAGGRSRLPESTLDLFVENPFWTIQEIAARLNVAFTTAQRAVDRLESLGIVAQLGNAKRNRFYCAESILKVLYEPAHIPA